MPQIVDIVTAPPPYVVEQAQATAFARSHFGDALPNIDRLLPLFANTGIKTRRLSQPTRGISSSTTSANEIARTSRAPPRSARLLVANSCWSSNAFRSV